MLANKHLNTINYNYNLYCSQTSETFKYFLVKFYVLSCWKQKDLNTKTLIIPTGLNTIPFFWILMGTKISIYLLIILIILSHIINIYLNIVNIIISQSIIYIGICI
jgi:hypothetical protein